MYLVLHGSRQDAFYGFRRGSKRFCMVSVIGFLMVSVVAEKRCFMVSVAGLLVDSAAAGGSIILECIERFLVLCVFRTGFRRWFVLWFPSWKENICYMVSVLGFVMVSVAERNVFNGFRRRFVLWFPAATGPRLSLRWKP